MPSASGKAPLAERPAFGAIYPNDAVAPGRPADHVRGRWGREGRYKLVVPGPAKPSLPLSLFDLQADPEEANNLAGRPEHAERVTDLWRLLDEWWPEDDNSRVTQPD